MRIAIDISTLCRSRTGVALFTYYTLRELTLIDNSNTYFLYVNKAVSLDFPLPPNFFIRPTQIPLPQFQLWFHIGLPMFLRSDKIDIFHGTNFLIPPFPGCKTVSTVHDLSSLVMPSQHKTFHRISHGLFLKNSMRRADAIIAVSEFTRSEISRLFPEMSDKTVVIHEAVSPEFRAIEDVALLRNISEKHGLPERFILFVGTLEPRKNIEGLMRAFAGIKGQIPHKLVIVGGRGWKFSGIFDLVKRLDIEDDIIFTDYVLAGDLPVIYNLADIFCYPSFYEGFGLPVLEAMACGTPVLTSNVSSLPEVAGNAALLFDPRSPEDIAERIIQLANNETLRAELSKAGLRRASEFSWADTAKKTLETYRRALE